MGCDIHMYSEAKLNDRWVCSDLFNINEYYDPNNNEPDDYDPQYNHIDIYHGRWYSLFGMLSDNVRGNSFTQSHPQRDIPTDTCDYIRQEYERYKDDYHSASWMTIEELTVLATKVQLHPNFQKIAKELIYILNEWKTTLGKVYGSYYVGRDSFNQTEHRLIYWFDN